LVSPRSSTKRIQIFKLYHFEEHAESLGNIPFSATARFGAVTILENKFSRKAFKGHL